MSKSREENDFPVTGQVAKQGNPQTLQECVGESQISKRAKATDRQMVAATKKLTSEHRRKLGKGENKRERK
jgi:hypothetical protein